MNLSSCFYAWDRRHENISHIFKFGRWLWDECSSIRFDAFAHTEDDVACSSVMAKIIRDHNGKWVGFANSMRQSKSHFDGQRMNVVDKRQSTLASMRTRKIIYIQYASYVSVWNSIVKRHQIKEAQALRRWGQSEFVRKKRVRNVVMVFFTIETFLITAQRKLFRAQIANIHKIV